MKERGYRAAEGSKVSIIMAMRYTSKGAEPRFPKLQKCDCCNAGPELPAGPESAPSLHERVLEQRRDQDVHALVAKHLAWLQADRIQAAVNHAALLGICQSFITLSNPLFADLATLIFHNPQIRPKPKNLIVERSPTTSLRLLASRLIL